MRVFIASSARSTIDAIAPDIVYTYGAAISLNPLLCRRFLCRHKAFKVVHGWDALSARQPGLQHQTAVNATRDIPVYSWAEIAEQFEEYFRLLLAEHSSTIP